MHLARNWAPLLCLLAACDGPASPADNLVPADDTAAGDTCSAWTYAGAPVAWALPASAPAGAFTEPDRDVADCSAGLPVTRVADLTGDGLPDLVALTDCEDATVGQVSWRVWPGGAGGFGDELSWTLPSGYGPSAFGGFTRDAADCATTDDLPAYFLADLDGDGREDLVVTASCSDATLESGAWRVYPNTGTGFGEPTDRAFASAWSNGAFTTPQAVVTCAMGANIPAWGLRDLDGDADADIVLTDTCTSPIVGETVWQVLLNDGTSFSEMGWSVPDELVATSLERQLIQCPSAPAHFLLDIDGDDRPELVAPYACDDSGSAWTVYPNEGDDFSAVAARLTAPLYLNYVVTLPERMEPECATGTPSWSLEDSTGDTRADILLTSSCSDASVGETWWDLLPGTVDGWPYRTPVSLPTGYSPGTFRGSRGATLACGGTASRPAWSRRDLDGDGVPEIVVTAACDDPEVGTSSWRVYPMVCADPG